MASKFEAFTRLSADDKAALARVSRNVRVVEPRRDLVTEGDQPRHVHLVLDGWACRYKQLPDGKRQIVAFFLPGDFCDVNVYILKEMDHSIGAITRLKAAMITPDEMSALTSERPRVTQALWWHELVTASDPARMDAEPRSAQRLRAARAPAFGALPASRGRRAGR